MSELLYFCTLYAPVLFMLTHWFGPGWCCPPPCPNLVPCEQCSGDDGPIEFQVEVSGIEDRSQFDCDGAKNINGTWILTYTGENTITGLCFWQYLLDSSERAGIAWRYNSATSSCDFSTNYAAWDIVFHANRIDVGFRANAISGPTTNPNILWRIFPRADQDCVGIEDLEVPFESQDPASTPIPAWPYDASDSTLKITALS